MTRVTRLWPSPTAFFEQVENATIGPIGDAVDLRLVPNLGFLVNHDPNTENQTRILVAAGIVVIGYSHGAGKAMKQHDNEQWGTSEVSASSSSTSGLRRKSIPTEMFLRNAERPNPSWLLRLKRNNCSLFSFRGTYLMIIHPI